MTKLIFIPITLLYALEAALVYVPRLKNGPFFYAIGVTLPMIANFLWLWSARRTPSADELFILGVYWDICVTLSFLVLPVMFFGVKVPPTGYLGLALIIIGSILMKASIR